MCKLGSLSAFIKNQFACSIALKTHVVNLVLYKEIKHSTKEHGLLTGHSHIVKKTSKSINLVKVPPTSKYSWNLSINNPEQSFMFLY